VTGVEVSHGGKKQGTDEMIVAFPDIESMSGDDFVAYAESCIASGKPILPPQTREQLRRFAEEFPERARLYIPPQSELRRLGLSANLCRGIESLPVEDREAFVRTLDTDAGFRRAVAGLLASELEAMR
jgi:hypothetical protein